MAYCRVMDAVRTWRETGLRLAVLGVEHLDVGHRDVERLGEEHWLVEPDLAVGFLGVGCLGVEPARSLLVLCVVHPDVELAVGQVAQKEQRRGYYPSVVLVALV